MKLSRIQKNNVPLKRQSLDKDGHPAKAHTSKRHVLWRKRVLSNFTHTFSIYDSSHTLKLRARSPLTMQGLSAVSRVNLVVNSIKSRTHGYIKIGLLSSHHRVIGAKKSMKLNIFFFLPPRVRIYVQEMNLLTT